jgi:hypothetical protein
MSANYANFNGSAGLARQKILGLADRHFSRGETSDRFQEITAMQAGFLRGAVWQNRSDHDVAGAFAEIQAGFTGAGVRRLFFIFGIFAGSEIAGLRIERLQQAVERASRDKVHVGIVDIVLLDFLQDFAVDLKRLVRLVIGGAAEDMADAYPADDENRND